MHIHKSLSEVADRPEKLKKTKKTVPTEILTNDPKCFFAVLEHFFRRFSDRFRQRVDWSFTQAAIILLPRLAATFWFSFCGTSLGPLGDTCINTCHHTWQFLTTKLTTHLGKHTLAPQIVLFLDTFAVGHCCYYCYYCCTATYGTTATVTAAAACDVVSVPSTELSSRCQSRKIGVPIMWGSLSFHAYAVHNYLLFQVTAFAARGRNW